MWGVLAAALALFISGSAPQQHAQHTPEQKAYASQKPAPVKQEPASSSGQSSGCPGTRTPQLSCDAITAEATARQADLMKGNNWLSLVTTLVAGVAAAFAASASFAARDTLTHERKRSAAELRPWVEFSVNVTKFEADADGFEIEYEMAFKNIGSTVAKHFTFKSETKFGGGYFEFIDAQFAQWKEPTEPDRFALMPGEERRYSGMQSTMKRVIPWSAGRKGPRIASFVVMATAFYRSDLDDVWHRTDRSFSIGRRSDRGFLSGYFLYEDMIGEGTDLVFVRPSIAGETT